ncbi:hypothetical protein Tco_1420318 [Tanacetum coccineum]
MRLLQPLTEFKLKKILIDKIEKSESYLAALEHRDCYDSLKKSYDLDKDFFFSYDVYSLKRGKKDKDKDEDPSVGLDRGLKKRKASKDAEPTTGQKKKDSTSGSSNGTKSQLKSFGKSVQSEELVFEVADLNMPQDQEGNMGDNENEPKNETASRRDWFKKPTPHQEPTDPDWNIGKTTQERPTQRPAFRLLKGTHSNYAELEYDFEECYKALSEKLDWENPEGGIEDMVPNIWSSVKVAYDRYALWGISHWRKQRKSSLICKSIQSKRRCIFYSQNGFLEFKEGDFLRLRINDIEDMLILVVQNQLINLSGDHVVYFAIALRMFTRSLVIQKRVEDLQLGVKIYQKKIKFTKPATI